ncbi:MAG: mannose-6-phosphate isomerase, partial [Lentisphaeria bacterium]|nr:mannose-6-phosphate isomerase [Lentisphaeria bacterium]
MLNTNKNERAPLYPLLFDVYYKNVIWGGNGFETYLNRSIPAHSAPAGEAWEICDRPEVSSRVMNGALSGISLHDLLLLYGEQLVGKLEGNGLRNFPVMIKWIDATQDNSLHVHP